MWYNKAKAENYCYRYYKKRKLLQLSIAFNLQDQSHFINFGNEENTTYSGETALYEIGSLTKLLVAAVYAQWFDSGRLQPGHTLHDLLEHKLEISTQFRDITIGSLLDHTSGLPRLPEVFLNNIEDENNPYRDYDESILQEYLAFSDDQLSGNKYGYSNLGYGILGFVLTSIMEQPLFDIIKERILDPLEMRSTTSTQQLLKGHSSSGREMPYWEMNCFQGAGFLISNTTDLIKYLVAHFEDRLTFLSLTTDLRKNKRVALAWHKYGFLSKIFGFDQYLWHNGMTGGFSSYASINPRKKIAVCALTNKTDDLTECILGLSAT
jgi:CubicO group peptidase (beta-lactamase class C family)